MTTQNRAIVDKLLTNVSTMHLPEGYIAEDVLPMQPTVQYTGLIGDYGNDHLRIVNSFTGGKSGYQMVNSIVRGSNSYSIQDHGLKDVCTKRDYANVEKPFDAESDKVIGLTSLLITGKEKALADVLSDNTVITNTSVPVTKYDDYAGLSNLLADRNAAVVSIKNATGAVANTAIMSWEVAEALKYNPALLESLGFKEQRPGGLQDQELAKALNVRRVLIGGASYNAAQEGQADNMQPLWSDVLLFAHIPLKAGLRQTTLGYRMQLAGQKPRQVHKFAEDEPIGSKKIIVTDEYDQVLTDTGAAYLLTDVLT